MNNQSLEQMKQEAATIRQTIDDSEKQSAVLTGQVHQLEQQLSDITDEIKSHGYDPENLNGELEKLYQEANNHMAALRSSMPATTPPVNTSM